MHLPTFADVIEQIMLILQFTNTKITFDLLAAELANAGWARPKCTLYTFMRSANRTASRHGRPLRFGYGNGFCWLDPLSKPVSNPAIIALLVPKRVGLRKLPPVVLLPCSDFPGRSFQLTHLDGDASGILKAQFTNSPIVCFYLPVDKIRDLSRTGDYMLLSDVGAYILICRGPDKVLRFRAGESLDQGLVGRIAKHEIQKTQNIENALLVTYVDRHNKGRGHTKYIESILHRMALDAFAVPPVLPQEIDSIRLSPDEVLPLKDVIHEIHFSARSFGLNIFERSTRYPDDRPIFRLTTKHGIWAEGWYEQRGEDIGFKVRAGSMIATKVLPSLAMSGSGYDKIRAILLQEGGPIRALNGELRFFKDCWFSCARQAASIVLGQSSSETKSWEKILRTEPESKIWCRRLDDTFALKPITAFRAKAA